jgi:predicted nucleotidyltransferase
MFQIQLFIPEIKNLCIQYHVNKLYVFGSVLSDKFNDNSDIDLVVDFKQLNLLDYADNYFDFKFSLEDILKRKIDLLEESAIKNPYFLNNLNQQKKLLYG